MLIDMKTTERNLLDILLIILLFVAIGVCVHSCIKCKESLDRLQEIKENEIPTIKIY
nr:MAG TPA: Eclosion hormone [Caudoviricetes sp.]